MSSKWTIKYFLDTDEFLQWLESLEEIVAESVYKELGLLEIFGNMLRLPHSRALGSKLFELRERRFGCRIYYTFQDNKIIILLTAGDKSTQEKDIKVARKRMELLVKHEVKMKLGKFKDLAKKRFTKEKIQQMDREIALEAEAMRSLQKNIKEALDSYMEQHNIGFNEVVRRLGSTPRQIAQIQKGNANLRMSTLAHISALLGQTPTITFKKK